MSPPKSNKPKTNTTTSMTTPRNWAKINERVWALLGAILLSALFGIVIYSHWVYFGCDLARESESGRLALFRDMLNPNCPATDLLPKTPLQNIALSILPYHAEVAKFSYGMACKTTVLGSASATCESLFALSFLSAISEWVFYIYLIIKMIHNFVVKPIFNKMLTILLVLSVGLLIGKLSECYASSVFGEELAPRIVHWAQITNRLICEAAAFVCSVCISVFHAIRRIVLVDEYPGASLVHSLSSSVPFIKARMEDWKSAGAA